MRRDTLYVAANVFPYGGMPGRRALVILRQPGNAVPVLPGDFLFAYPQIAIGRDGTLHLAWVELDGGAAGSAWGGFARRLLYATFQEGRWSDPDTILQGRSVLWRAGGAHMALDADDAVHIGLTADYNDQLGILHMRRSRGGSWELRRLASLPYPASIAVGGDTIVLAYFAEDREDPARPYSLHLYVSTDRGSHWLPPVAKPIDQSDRQLSPPAFAFANEGLAIGWLSKGSELTAGFHSAHFSPATRQIEPHPVVPLPGGVPLSLRLATSSCGVLATLIERVVQSPDLAATGADGTLEVQEVRRWKGATISRPFPYDPLSLGLIERDDQLIAVFAGVDGESSRLSAFSSTSSACGGQDAS